MIAEEIARAIYQHHRRSKLAAKRRDRQVPTFDELPDDQRTRRVAAAAELARTYGW